MKAAAKKTKPVSKAKTAKTMPAKKALSKPVAKSTAKPVAKTSAKKAVKPTPKATPKAAPKAPQKAVPKAASKATSKPLTSKKPVKAAAPKPVLKTAAKVAAKKPAPAPVSKPKAVTPQAKAPVKPPVKAAAPVVPAKASSPEVALRQTARPATSSRKGANHAPPAPQSMPASGAKASFLPNMTPTIAPPPQMVVKKDPKLVNNWKTKEASALSDAEVLAMPDGEYMNEKQMAFFRQKLIQLKKDILASADETTEHLREDTVIVPDPADRATIEEEHALELRTRDRERKLLKKIEQSIARIDAGDYGYCDETGEPIGVGRLLARPTATLSLEAQQRRELKQRMFGD
jgi:DnaK suppressor protein